MSDFEKEVSERVSAAASNEDLRKAASDFMRASILPKYSYNFSWMGRPIIQYPQDMVAVQELIWKIRPDLIIETGIAHGGSLIFNASMLALLDMCEAIEKGSAFDPSESKRKVIGVDIDIRSHNRKAIEEHPMSSRIEMIQGSSIDPAIVSEVMNAAAGYEKTMVFLDSNHTHDHVLEELKAYAPLVNAGSYCIVFDTVVEDLPEEMFPDRPWCQGNNPKTAVWEYLKSHPEFQVDRTMDQKLLISVAPNGYLERIS